MKAKLSELCIATTVGLLSAEPLMLRIYFRFRRHSGPDLLTLSFSHFDPEATSRRSGMPVKGSRRSGSSMDLMSKSFRKSFDPRCAIGENEPDT
jgi:hypothetical protein